MGRWLAALVNWLDERGIVLRLERATPEQAASLRRAYAGGVDPVTAARAVAKAENGTPLLIEAIPVEAWIVGIYAELASRLLRFDIDLAADGARAAQIREALREERAKGSSPREVADRLAFEFPETMVSLVGTRSLLPRESGGTAGSGH